MRSSILILFVMLSISASSQNRSLQLGAKLINNLTFYNDLGVGFGGQVVYRLKKHATLESGLYYCNRPQGFITDVYFGNSVSSYYFKVNERRLWIPLLYRYNAKLLNFSSGIIMDYFIGWKQVTGDDPGVKVNSYSNSTVQIAATAGISKSFFLTEKIIIEPEVLLHYRPADEDGGVGFNLAIRKKLF